MKLLSPCVLLVFFSFSLNAGEVLVNSSCEILVKTSGELYKSTLSKFTKRATLKGYKFIGPFEPSKKLKKDQLYAVLSRKDVGGGLFAPCKISVEILRIKDAKSQMTKRVFFEEKVRRKPRVTFAGKTRCKFAMQDATEFLPQCETFRGDPSPLTK